MSDDILRVDRNTSPLTSYGPVPSSVWARRTRRKPSSTHFSRGAEPPHAEFQLGLLNYNDKNFKQADTIFRQIQQANPGDTRGLIGVVETQVAQKDFNNAIQTVQAELAKDPNARITGSRSPSPPNILSALSAS